MIVVSGVLVLVALVLLVIGLLGEGLGMIWASIITSLVAGVFLLLGALQRRGAPAPAAEGATTTPDSTERVTAVNVRPREEAPAQAAAPVAEPAAATSPEVSVVPGRPRYHVASCRFLTGRPDVQNVPVDEARADGFTACGVCKPDAALEQAETALATAPETTDTDEDASEATAAFEAADVSAGADDTASDEAAAPSRARKAPAKAPAKRAAAAKPARATATAAAPAADDAAAPAKAAKPAKKAAAAASGGTAGQVVVIPDRGKFHTGMCRFVKDVPGTVNLTKAAAKRQGYTPCGVCKP